MVTSATMTLTTLQRYVWWLPTEFEFRLYRKEERIDHLSITFQYCLRLDGSDRVGRQRNTVNPVRACEAFHYKRAIECCIYGGQLLFRAARRQENLPEQAWCGLPLQS